MYVLMNTADKLALIVFLALPLHAADQVRRFYTEAGSTFTIDGDNNLHSWKVQTKEPAGWIEFDAGFAAMSGRTLKPGKIYASMEGYIPVRSLHINEGPPFDKVMERLLREESNPRICYRLLELSLKTGPKAEGEPYIFDSQVELVVAGVTNRISMPLHVVPLSGDKLKIRGDTSLRMSDFRIEPFQFPLSDPPGSTVKYGDKVELSFEWFVAPKTAMRD
jgi:hypothetical protein